MPAGTRLKGDTLKLETYFPIPKFQDIPQDRIVEIENLSKKIIELSKENNVKSTKMLAIKIDSLIASIYGLTQNEINELC